MRRFGKVGGRWLRILLLVEGCPPALASQVASRGGLSLDSSCFVFHGVVIGYMPLYIGQTEQRNKQTQEVHKSAVLVLNVNDDHRDACGDENG